MKGNLELAAEAIAAKASEVTGIEVVETKPKFVTGRKFPAIFVSYIGFKQAPLTYRSNKMSYSYVMTLYLKLDGRNIVPQWDVMLEMTNKIADTFRSSFTLDGAVYKAEIKRGKVVIDIPKNPDRAPMWLGHRFELDVSFEETIE